MARYALKRLGWLCLVWLGASFLTFSLSFLAPGDPAQIKLRKDVGESPTQAQIEATREELGLDRPFLIQYLGWLQDASHGDFGESWSHEESVARLIWRRLGATVSLALTAGTLTILVAVVVGVLAAYRRNSVIDHASRFVALAGASVPNYFLAYLLILIFSVQLQALPVFGSGSAAHIILPAFTLAVGLSATLTRLTRSAMLEVLQEDYMKMGRAKGLGSGALLFRHALKNASIPVVTAGGLMFAGLLNGTIIVEWVFSWPGLGKLAIDAIHARDYPVIEAFVILAATFYVGVNFAIDILYGWLDPRVKEGLS